MKIWNKKVTSKDIYQILLVIFVSILLIAFFPQIQINFSGFPDNTKSFLTTLGAAGVGVALFFIKKFVEKKHEKLKDIAIKQKIDHKQLVFTIELFEMFMFLMMPTLASYSIIPELIKQYPYLITIIFLLVVGGWFLTSLFYITKRDELGDKKIVKTHIYTFGGQMMFMGIVFTFLIMYIDSLSKYPTS